MAIKEWASFVLRLYRVKEYSIGSDRNTVRSACRFCDRIDTRCGVGQMVFMRQYTIGLLESVPDELWSVVPAGRNRTLLGRLGTLQLHNMV